MVPSGAAPSDKKNRLEWRIKGKAPMDPDDVSEDDSGEEPKTPLLREDTPPPQPMDISMVFTLPAEFRANPSITERAIA